MAFDTVAKRTSTAEKLQAKGFLLTIRQPEFSGGLETGRTPVTAWAVQKTEARPAQQEVDVRDIRFVISAVDASSGDVLTLNVGDYVDLDTGAGEIVDPGVRSPNRTASAEPDPIVYFATVRASASPLSIRQAVLV